MNKFRRTVTEAFPELETVVGSHGDFRGHRASRDYIVAFRLRDQLGKYRPNIVLVMSAEFSRVTVDDVR